MGSQCDVLQCLPISNVAKSTRTRKNCPASGSSENALIKKRRAQSILAKLDAEKKQQLLNLVHVKEMMEENKNCRTSWMLQIVN